MKKKDFIVRRSITMVEGKPRVETYSEQELVRCKDCKYYKDETARDNNPSWLPCMSVQTMGNWFCADGVKRDE